MKTTVMKLTVYERLTIPSLLPEKGNYETGIKIRDIRQKCELSQEELAVINFQTIPSTEGGFRATWNEGKAAIKEITFTELELLLIRTRLREMDKKEELPCDVQFIKLYEQFTKEE